MADYEYPERGFNKGPGTFIIAYHIFLLIGLPIYLMNYTPSIAMVVTAIVLYFACGMSITGAYHRYYAHRCYQVHPAIEAVLLFFGSLAAQGSVIRWSFDHRLHHAKVDTYDDPYSIKKGFWYAHIGWLFEKPRPVDGKFVADLLKNKWLTVQDRYYGTTLVITNAIVWLVVGYLLNDYLGAFMIAIVARIFFLHHCTWFVNSLAHTWGDKPFSEEQSAVNNFIVSVLTFGEGYHNFHHTFANDYRNGIRWYHVDPTKWMIWTLSKLGLAWNLKTTDAVVIKKRMVITRKELLMERLGSILSEKKEEFEKAVNEQSERLLAGLAEFNELRKKGQPEELKQLQKSLQSDWKQWKQLSSTIFEIQPCENIAS